MGGIRVTFGLEVVVTARAWLTGVVTLRRRAGDTVVGTVRTVTVVAGVVGMVGVATAVGVPVTTGEVAPTMWSWTVGFAGPGPWVVTRTPPMAPSASTAKPTAMRSRAFRVMEWHHTGVGSPKGASSRLF
jgi:hypothetical protein